MRQRHFIFLFLLLLGAVSCVEKEVAADGAFTLSLHTGAPRTRAVTPGDGNVADGGGIFIDAQDRPDLVVLVANASGSIVQRYPGDGAVLQTVPAPAPENVEVSFTSLEAGNYTVYAFANTQGLWPMSGTLEALSTAAQASQLQFAPMEADVAPVCLQGRLPLSAMGTVQVFSKKNGSVSLEMLRCVAKVSLSFVNHTGATLKLDEFSFSLSELCPSCGYVLPHVLPDVPGNASYGHLVKSATSGHSLADKDSTVFDFLVFPGVSPSGHYLMDVGFRANGATALSSFSGLPVHDDHGVDIPSLDRNQHLKIETRISRGLHVSFNFKVAGWDSLTEQVLFE